MWGDMYSLLSIKCLTPVRRLGHHALSSAKVFYQGRKFLYIHFTWQKVIAETLTYSEFNIQ